MYIVSLESSALLLVTVKCSMGLCLLYSTLKYSYWPQQLQYVAFQCCLTLETCARWKHKSESTTEKYKWDWKKKHTGRSWIGVVKWNSEMILISITGTPTLQRQHHSLLRRTLPVTALLQITAWGWYNGTCSVAESLTWPLTCLC